MPIKAFPARLTSGSKRGNTPHGNATARVLLGHQSSPRQRVNHVPFRKERQSSPKEIFRSAIFTILPKAFASRTKRIVRRANSLLSCMIPQRSMHMDVPAQSEIPEVDMPSPVSGESTRSAMIEALEIMQEQSSPSFGSDTEHEKAGKECLECELVEQEPSQKESKKVLIVKREKKPYRYYHRLPCEEEKPSVEKGIVSRLSLMFEHSPTNGLSSEEFIKGIPSAAICDMNDGFARKKGESKDDNFDNAPAHLIKTSHNVPREMLEDTASSASAEHEEQRHNEAVSGDVNQKSEVHMLKSSGVAPQEALQNHSSFKMSRENGVCSAACSVDSLVEGVEKSNMGSSRVVTFHETAALAENVRNDDWEDVDMTTRQVSFRSDEDYCTPILEFELKDIGCGLQ